MGVRLKIGQRFGRSLGLALTTLALIVSVITPPGFMVTPTAQGAALVICTGHGPLLAAGQLGHPGKTPKSANDAPCLFAGHHAAPGPELAIIAPPTDFVSPLPIAKTLIDQAPGRGLAAPPPPSQGPPVRL